MTLWKLKGSDRKPVGLLGHTIAGAVVQVAFSRIVGPEFDGLWALGGVCMALAFGFLWELFGYRRLGWDPNFLDLVPWPLGAGLIWLMIGIRWGW